MSIFGSAPASDFSSGSSQPYHRALQVSPTEEPYNRQLNRRALQQTAQQESPTIDSLTGESYIYKQEKSH